MDVRAVRGALRPGLVAAAIAAALLAAGLAFAQQGGRPAAGPAGSTSAAPQQLEMSLRGWEEIAGGGRPRAYTRPAWLLLLAPGALFLGYALLSRLWPRRLPFLFLLLPLLLGASSEQAERLVREAEGLYGAGEYAEALLRYREAAELLPGNPALYHDLGVAAHRAGQRGRAIAAFRRCLKVDPHDAGARAALRHLEEAYGLEAQVPLPLPVHPDLFFFLTLGLANAALVMAGLVIRRGRVQFLIVLVLAGVFAAASLGVFLARVAAENRPVGVLAENTRLLRIPDPDSRTWLELPAGSALRVRGRAAGYLLVQTGSQFRGWVSEERVLLD